AGAIRELGTGGRFDPTPYLRQLRGRGGNGEYLDVKWRLLWVRTEYPDAKIETEHVLIEPSLAVFKAKVSLPNGALATGYGSETPGDFGDYIEKAETKAIGRALNALGYGAQFREPGDDEPVPSSRPGDAGRSGLGGNAAPAGRQSSPQPRGGRDSGRPIELNAAQRQRPAAEPVAPPVVAAAVSADADEAFGWTQFRVWVTGQGLNSREAINALVGRDTTGMDPIPLRDLILEARARGGAASEE
ncbi:MAG: hypothetical protein ACR2J8_06360, partial [Thermomicrobiales bacterium]